jgi:trehalose-6-phosphatase
MPLKSARCTRIGPLSHGAEGSTISQDDPRRAQPDNDLFELLAALRLDTANEILILSGRSRRDLEEWFGALAVALDAEHGALVHPNHDIARWLL